MNPETAPIALVVLGAIFLAGLAADVVGRRTRIPRVTLLLLLGVSVGPLGFDLFPNAGAGWFPFIANLALVMVAFLLGGQLTVDSLRENGREVLVVSLVVVLLTAATVAVGLVGFGWPLPLALLLGAVATSTDPIAVSDVVKEAGAEGRVTRTLLGVVAVDDAWGIVAMSIVLAFVVGSASPEAAQTAVWNGFADLIGAIVVGCAVGMPIAFLSGRVRSGEPTQAEALGGVLLCGGIALLLDVSLLLAAMTMGVVVTNFARHHTRPFHAIEGIEWPFMVLFFVFAGASLDVKELGTVLVLTPAYILLRVLGRGLGGWAGIVLSKGSAASPRTVGFGLLPQAGVAIGMALVASQHAPEFGRPILAATVAGTIVFEVVGPIVTRFVLVSSGETRTD